MKTKQKLCKISVEDDFVATILEEYLSAQRIL